MAYERWRCTTCGADYSHLSGMQAHRSTTGHKSFTHEKWKEGQYPADAPMEALGNARARAREHGETGKREIPSTRDKDTAEIRAREQRPERPTSLLAEEMQGEHNRGMNPKAPAERPRHLMFWRGTGLRKLMPDRWGPDTGGGKPRVPWYRN